MTMARISVAFALCSSMICIGSLRPSDAVVSTAGRASHATAEKPLRLVEDKIYSLQASQPVVVTTTTLPPTTTTTHYHPPTTTPPVQAEPVSEGSQWDRLAECETGQSPPDWHINTGNGYYGGLQFSLSSWQAVGGTGYPHEFSREVQIEMGERLKAQGGWGHWPACSRKLGLR